MSLLFEEKKVGIRNKSSKRKHGFAAYLRRNLTCPEVLLWKRLGDKKLGVRFYSQQLVYGYIADFYCAKALLVVEVDGPCHSRRKVYDKNRDAVLWKMGILTMRFSDEEVEKNLSAVVALIADRVRKRLGR